MGEGKRIREGGWIGVLPVALVLAAGAPVRAVDLDLPGIQSASLHGYYKNFFLALESSEPFLDSGQEDLNRARLMFEAAVTPHLDFAVHYEQFATIHPIAGTALFVGPTARPGIWDLSWTILSDENVLWQQEIDRLYVRGHWGPADVTVGRQAIGWGVGAIWAPLDLFAAFSPVALDREFRVGVDAARALVSLGPFTEVEAAYALYDGSLNEQSAGVRGQTTLEESDVDVGIVAGKFFEDVVAGAYAAGQIRGVGVNGSASVSHHYTDSDPGGPRDFALVGLGADYRFAGDVIVLGEYYLNGFGASNPDDYVERAQAPIVQRGQLFNVGRHYLGFAADWQVHPLVHLIAQGQWNLLDPSAQVGPAFSLSLSDEAQLDAGIYFAVGAGADGLLPRSEFGSFPDVYYVTAKVYF